MQRIILMQELQVYILMLIPDTPVVEGKAVRFLFVNIDPIPSSKQAHIQSIQNIH